MSNLESPRERLSLDEGWRFHLGDIPYPKLISHSDSYRNAKAGRIFGAAAPDYDDTAWRELSLPHDWASESAFDPEENLSQGYRRRGFGWYRRHFRLEDCDRGRHLELQFDGVATHCTVWLNGSVLHRNWCGYTSFYLDATPFACYGEELNTIAVRVDAEAMEGWWYEGAGIYRHTWLVKRNATHIATDGVFAHPVQADDGSWSLPVEVTIANAARAAESVEVEVSLFSPAGQFVGGNLTSVCVESLGEKCARLDLPVTAPMLWSLEAPLLYQVYTTLKARGRTLDRVVTTCGFRTVRFDADEGFFLNDRPLKLQGVCNHQDHAGVGVAIPDALWEWRLRQLKEMGVNAYRCAHNPPAVEFLELCDRMGILVMDENRHFNCSGEYLRQLDWLIRRDRNHPSVILWSVFNEEPAQGSEVGVEMIRRMVAAVKRLDTTRPVTAAMNGGLFSPSNVSQAVDVVGFNYQIDFYDRFHAANPALPLTSSEDTSAFMTRGEYQTEVARNIRDSYDTQFAPWGASHSAAWQAIAERPFLAGGFIWTGFDYHGEPTPHQWPSASSFFGCLDLCGFPKAAFHIHRALWRKDIPVLEIIPHWNWPGREGHLIKVVCLTNAERVSLWLNDKPLGEKQADPFAPVSWQVPYEAGRLEAVALQAGREVARARVETTGAPFALKLVPDRAALAGDGSDAQPVTVSVVDQEGRAVPTANLKVEFELEGAGAIIGLGNGDPNSHEPEKGNSRSLFNGLAQVILQTFAGSSGSLRLRAKGEGIAPAELVIEVAAVTALASVPKAEPVLFLRGWHMSPLSNEPLDPNLVVADNDMNTWPGVQTGELQSFFSGRWGVCRLRFRPFHAVQRAGGRITFKALTGKAEVWLDQALLGTKETFTSGALEVTLPPRVGERVLSVLFEAEPGQLAGFDGAVVVTKLVLR